MSVAENIKNVRERMNAACASRGKRSEGGHPDLRQQDEAGLHVDGGL